MKLVVDTNVFLSGMLWEGPPNRIIRAAETAIIQLCGTVETRDEFRTVANYERLQGRLLERATSPQRLVFVYESLVTLYLTPQNHHAPYVPEDPSDDMFIEAAQGSGATIIVSGDGHLTRHAQIAGVHILKPKDCVAFLDLMRRTAYSTVPKRFPRHPRLARAQDLLGP